MADGKPISLFGDSTSTAKTFFNGAGGEQRRLNVVPRPAPPAAPRPPTQRAVNAVLDNNEPDGFPELQEAIRAATGSSASIENISRFGEAGGGLSFSGMSEQEIRNTLRRILRRV